jgi:hypothetical protein
MIVELLSTHYLSDPIPKSEDYPQCVYKHIRKVIKERSKHIEDEYEDSDEDEKECMKLKLEDFRVVVWMIDDDKYYDICHFKDDAEVGFIMKYDNDKLTKICEVDEAALMPLDKFKHMKKWRETFEEGRVRILEL